jgi:hypothetical protein
MGKGRPKYEPTEADRNTVRSMAATEFPHPEIAKCLGTSGIDGKTLRKHFRRELDTAAGKANAAVANKAYQMAIAGDPPAATFFWLKCRGGWKERHEIKQEIEHSGPGGNALKVEVTRVNPRRESKPPDSSSPGDDDGEE